MKKRFLKLGVLFAGALLTFSSCNKKKLDEMQAQLDSQETTLNNLNSAVSTDSPLSGSFSGTRGVDDVAFNIAFSHSFIWSQPQYSSEVDDNGNGTYDISIERYETTVGSHYSELSINNFDPTAAISLAEVYFYMEDRQYQADIDKQLYFSTENYVNWGANANTITVNSISYNNTTKQFSINASINDATGSENTTGNACTGSFTFSGTLNVSDQVTRYGNQ